MPVAAARYQYGRKKIHKTMWDLYVKSAKAHAVKIEALQTARPATGMQVGPAGASQRQPGPNRPSQGQVRPVSARQPRPNRSSGDRPKQSWATKNQRNNLGYVQCAGF